MAFWDDIKAAEAEVAAEIFGDATLIRTIASSFNPVTGATVAGSSVIACRAEVQTITVRGANGARLRETIASVTVEPQAGDILTIGADHYTVTAIERDAPLGEAFAWRAVLK